MASASKNQTHQDLNRTFQGRVVPGLVVSCENQTRGVSTKRQLQLVIFLFCDSYFLVISVSSVTVAYLLQCEPARPVPHQDVPRSLPAVRWSTYPIKI